MGDGDGLGPARTAVEEPPRHVTRPLLERIVEESQDSEYAEAAARREAAPPTGRSTPGRAAVAMGGLGLLLAMALLETSASAGTTQTGRAAMIAGISEQRDDLARQQAELSGLLAENAELEQRLERLSQDEQQAVGRMRRLQARTGFLAVQGPGVRMTVDDGPGGDDVRLVRADDLGIVVAGLWAAGAEAVSVSGERVTAVSPLTDSGASVRLNGRALRAPYVVLAVGDPRSLQSRFLETTYGLEWLELVRAVGFGWEVQDAEALTLPAARPRPLRAASPLVKEAER